MLIGGPSRVRLPHHPTLPIVYLYGMMKDKRLIDIDRYTILQGAILLDPLHIPRTRHLDIIPCRSIKGRFVKLHGSLRRVPHPVKLPGSIKAHVISTLLRREVGTSPLVALKVKKVSPRLLLIIAQLSRRLPLTPCRAFHIPIFKACNLVELLGTHISSPKRETKK